MTEKTFNKWFNVFILAGMAVCVVLATIMKLRGAEEGARTLLYISAGGALAGVVSTVLSANGSIWNFLFGLIDVLLYSFILYTNDQFSQLALHLLYILPMEFVGFFKWRKLGLNKDNTVKARRMPAKYWINVGVIFVAIAVAAFILSNVLAKAAGADTVLVKAMLDALITTANIVAFLLMAGAYAEQWYLWIMVNVCSIVLWALTGILTPGADYAVIPLIKYIFYLLNSFNGIRIWYALSREKSDTCICE